MSVRLVQQEKPEQTHVVSSTIEGERFCRLRGESDSDLASEARVRRSATTRRPDSEQGTRSLTWISSDAHALPQLLEEAISLAPLLVRSLPRSRWPVRQPPSCWRQRRVCPTRPRRLVHPLPYSSPPPRPLQSPCSRCPSPTTRPIATLLPHSS